MSDITQLGLFVEATSDDEETPAKLAADEYPSWYRPSHTRKTSNLRVLRGIHPRGRALGPTGSRCATCTHLVWSKRGNKSFKKCVWQGIGITRHPDVVMSWRGCELFDLAFPTHCAVVHQPPSGNDWQQEYIERLSLDQWLLVFEDDCKRLADLPQAVDVRVAIDALLAQGSVPGLDEWHHAKGMVQ